MHTDNFSFYKSGQRQPIKQLVDTLPGPYTITLTLHGPHELTNQNKHKCCRMRAWKHLQLRFLQGRKKRVCRIDIVLEMWQEYPHIKSWCTDCYTCRCRGCLAYHAFNALNAKTKECIYVSSLMITTYQMYIVWILNLPTKTCTLESVGNWLLSRSTYYFPLSYQRHNKQVIKHCTLLNITAQQTTSLDKKLIILLLG